MTPKEEDVLNLALAQSEEMFSDRVRSVFLYLMSTDETFKKEISRTIDRQMRIYKRQLAYEIGASLERLVHASPDYNPLDQGEKQA